MATVSKNFRIKQGLVVEGSTGTINGENILREGSGDSYIVNLIGGSADTANTPNTVVKRDGNGDFAAGTVTVNQVNIGEASSITDDGGDLVITVDSLAGDDFIVNADDIRLNADDDVILNATGSVTVTGTNDITLQSDNVYVGTNLNFVDSERVASQGYVDTAISNLDLTYNTDEITEGTGNLYFTDSRALDAVSNNLGTGIVYSSENAGNVFHIDENYLNTEITDGARSAVSVQFGGTPLTYDSSTGVFGINLAADNSIGLDGSNGLKVNRDVVDEWYDASGSASDALTDANAHTDAALLDYTTTVNLDSTVGGYGYLKSADLNGYATETYADNAADDAETAANTYTNNLIGDVTVDGTSGNTVTDRIESAVANLVNGAPELLDTLNELAAAIGDDENYATTVSGLIADKQNNLTAGSNIDITADTISVTGLDTDDVAEGTNLYYTDARVDSHLSGGDGIDYTAGNIDVRLGTGLEINGANQVAINRTTVDAWYDEVGSASLAQSAAEQTALGYVSDVLDGTAAFTDLNMNDVAKQVAARTTSLGSVPVIAYQFNKTSFKSGKFLVKIDNGTHNEISEILVTLDASGNVAITEYAIVGTNGTRGTITANTDATHCRIVVDPVNDSTITVTGTVFSA